MLPFVITREALLAHWSRALPGVLEYMAFPDAPFNVRGDADPLNNRRLYDWLPLGLACRHAKGRVPYADEQAIRLLALRYLNTPWRWELAPEQGHRLLGEVHAAIGLTLVLGLWPAPLLAVVKSYAETPNLGWSTDKLMLLCTALATQRRAANVAMIEPLLAEIMSRQQLITGPPGAGRGDDICWWPIATGEKYGRTPMSWSHVGRAYLMVAALRDAPGVRPPYGLLAMLTRVARASLDLDRGTTWEDCQGTGNGAAGQLDRALSCQWGHWDLLRSSAPDLVRAWCTGQLLTEHSKWPYSVDTNDASTRGLGRLTLAAAGLAVS